MKTKMMSVTLAAVLGIAGASSAYAQNYNSDTNEWIQSLIASSTSTGRHNGYAGPDSAATEIGQDLDSYGKTVRVKHNHAAERGGYTGPAGTPK